MAIDQNRTSETELIVKTNTVTKQATRWVGTAALWLVGVGLLGVVGCSKEAKLDRTLERATKQFQAGDLDNARIEFLNVWRLNRTNAAAIRHLGIILFDQGSPVPAYQFLVPAAQRDPNDCEVRSRLGTAHLALGQRDQARSQAIAVLDRSPTNDRAIFLLADVSSTPAEISDAEARLQKARQTSGDRASLHLATAELWRRRGEVAKVEPEVKQALALDPKSPFVHAALAGIYLAATNKALAEKELKMAAELAPLRSLVRIRCAELMADNGAIEEAKKQLQELSAKAPDYLPAWQLQAQIALSEKKFDEALAFTDRVLARDTANLDTRLLRPQIYLASGQPKLAVKELVELDRAFANTPQIKYELARAQLMNTNLPESLANLQRAISLNTNYTEAVLLLAELNLRNGDASSAATNLLRLSRKLASAMDAPSASPAERAQQATLLARAQFTLAQAYEVLGRQDDALAVYTRYTKAQPDNFEAWFLMGLVYRQQQKPREARAAIEEALRRAPGMLPAISQLVELDLIATNYPAALKRVQAASVAYPKSPELKIMEARIYAAQALWDPAEAALMKALELNPELVNPYFQLAQIYVAAKRLPQAAQKLQTLLDKEPASQRSLMLMGMIQSELGDYAKSQQAYESLLKVNPNFSPALNNLAYLYAERLGQFDKALELARKAADLRPGDPSAADTLGWILYRKGDYQQALTLLRESAAKLPKEAEIQYHLGMTYYMLGQAEAAKGAFQAAMAVGGNFIGKDEVQRRLSLLAFDASKPPKQLIADLEKLRQSNPDDLLVKTRLAELYSKTGATDKASALYEDILRQNPRSALATAALARMYASTPSSRDKGLAMAKKARELAPADPQVAHILGKMAFQSGDYPWAFSLLQESAQKLPGNAEVLSDFAWANYSLGRVPEANQLMTRALQATPRLEQTNAAQWFVLMTALASNPAGQARAEAQVKELLKYDPTNAPALMVLASLQAQRGEFKVAAATDEQVLARFPKFAPAQKQLAELYANHLNDDAKAWELGVKAREALPGDAELAKTLGTLAYRKRDYSYAVRLLQESVQKASNDAEGYFYLGMAQVQLKDKARAREALDKALTLNLAPAQATEARQALKGL
jgi:tetratricopeptide (TPR) repeat protein